MIAAGIDLGGTKIEAQVFDADWRPIAVERIATPDTYPDLLARTADLVRWARAGRADLPVGIGAAGRVNPATGHVFAANLAAMGHPFPTDIADATGMPITYLNDSAAFALSEAHFGAGRQARTVLTVIMGTGIGGGVVQDGAMLGGATGLGGEFGHMSAPAHLIAAHDLPIFDCGCGRRGCMETYLAGPGMARLAHHMTGAQVTPRDIAAHRAGDFAAVWSVWLALAGDLLHRLILTADPDVIVLGGGLSRIDGVTQALSQALARAQFGPFGVPPIRLAQAGDTSGARGAAYAAFQAEAVT